MTKISIYLYFLVAFVIFTIEARLVLVNVVFRHGDRTPSAGSEMFPKDPYNDELFYPIGRGGLTNQGKRREYKLGQILRERYDEFLGKDYVPGVLNARSTNYDRTKMSLQLVLASMFPPQEQQQWNNKLSWQPIPYTYVPDDDDNLLIPEECPQYLDELRQILISPEIQEKMSNYTNFMEKLRYYTGKNISNPYDMYNLYLGLMAEDSMNLTLPDWTDGIFPNGKLLNATYLYYDMFSYNTKMKRLNGGMLVREIIQNINKTRSNPTLQRPKIYLYSGHETNIAALLQALNVYNPHVPEFSSAVIVEVGESKNQYYVQVLYYMGIPPKLIPLRLPGCTQMCPFERFVNILSNVIPSNEERQCDKVHRKYNLDDTYATFGNYL